MNAQADQIRERLTERVRRELADVQHAVQQRLARFDPDDELEQEFSGVTPARAAAMEAEKREVKDLEDRAAASPPPESSGHSSATLRFIHRKAWAR